MRYKQKLLQTSQAFNPAFLESVAEADDAEGEIKRIEPHRGEEIEPRERISRQDRSHSFENIGCGKTPRDRLRPGRQGSYGVKDGAERGKEESHHPSERLYFMAPVDNPAGG